jgi:pimeloyl-ACP methyl ester carboxylesterase
MVGDVRIDTRLGPLDVRVVGEGPPAVLWHSLFVDSGSWKRVEADLLRERTLILISGPGHGSSGDPGRRYDMKECADAAIDILDAIAVADPVDWVGNAWGGHVGIVAATRHTHRVRSLVAISSPAAALAPAERRRLRFLIAAHRVLGPAKPLRSGVAGVLLSSATRATDPAAVDYVHEQIRNADRRAFRNAIESISLRRPDLTPLLPHISVPTLIITGGDDVGFTPDQAREATTLVPGGAVSIVDASAYLPPLERPGETARLILGFWERTWRPMPGRPSNS